MPLGKLDRNIIVQSYTESKNSYGEAEKTWATHSSVWAEIMEDLAFSGVEVKDGQTIASEVVRFRIRYDAAVNTKMRISYNSEYFYIRQVIEEGRNNYLILKTYTENG